MRDKVTGRTPEKGGLSDGTSRAQGRRLIKRAAAKLTQGLGYRSSNSFRVLQVAKGASPSRRDPRTSVVMKLAKALNVNVRELLE